MTELEAVELMTALVAAYPNAQAGEPTVEVYVSELLDLDERVAGAAVRALIETKPFLPSISEIRGTVARMTLQAPSTSEAFRQALNPGPRHALVDRARALVGDSWHWRNTESHFLRRPFLEAYAEVLSAATLSIQAPELASAESRAELETARALELPPAAGEEGPAVPPTPEFLEAARRLTENAEARRRSMIRPDGSA